MICEHITQAQYARNIYPDSINTIRIVTTRGNDGCITFPIAIHRFGNRISGCTDNACRGGLFCLIDIDTGMLGKAHSYRTRESYSCHPDTGVIIESSKVPNWHETLKIFNDVHKKFPYIPYMSWDVVMQDDGTFIVIEGNASIDMMLCQTFNEGLRYKPLGIFYQEKGILK